jgi:uncharacterized protein YjbI with pentapeptide repeats
MLEHENKPLPPPQRSTTEDINAWRDYWQKLGQPWRTEPEIDVERQQYLNERESITPDIKKGIYPFKDIKLSRADVEWLLATHENGRGPVNWNDESQRKRHGLELRGAILSQVNLNDLPLTCIRGGFKGTREQRTTAAIHLEGATLRRAHLEGAKLIGADLGGAFLPEAYLEQADLEQAHLEGVNLREAHLEGADLRNAFFDSATNLNGTFFGNARSESVQLAGLHWGDVDLTMVDWSLVRILGDERRARQREKPDRRPKNRNERLREYAQAVRANRQLAIALQAQGLNEDAARFAYRAHNLQRKVFWLQGVRKFGAYLFSLFLDLLTGYGYKVARSFFAYLLVISVFAVIYYLLGSHLAWNEAIVISMTAFHGRGFFPDQFHPGDPQALVAAIEAFVGLLIEVTFIATLTQRLFGK